MALTRHCWKCGREYTLAGTPGRSESCICGADLKVCLNCVSYDPRAAHQCRDRRADPVMDKHMANYCEYFEMARREFVPAAGETPPARKQGTRNPQETTRRLIVLSVCLITRNEEAALPRALKSVQGVADEIVVADTGSKDGTIEVAKSFGAVTCQFPWCDDFSAARNHAVRHARGDWIFWLDADEELLPESAEELRASIARADALAFFVRRQDLKRADDLNYYTMMWQLRLFRRRDDLVFRGRCHPEFHPDIGEVEARTGLKVFESTITMRHFGYLGELAPAKLRRGARLLELELRDRPGQIYYLIEFGRTLLMLQDERGHEILAQAAAALLPQAGEPEAPQPIVALLVEYFLQLPAERLPSGFRPELVEGLVWRWFPDNAPLLWILARRAAMAERFDEAEKILRRLVRMGQDHSYEQWTSFDPRLVGDDAKANLGARLVRRGKLDEAVAIFKELLASPSHAAQARSNLEAIEQFIAQAGPGRV